MAADMEITLQLLTKMLLTIASFKKKEITGKIVS